MRALGTLKTHFPKFKRSNCSPDVKLFIVLVFLLLYASQCASESFSCIFICLPHVYEYVIALRRQLISNRQTFIQRRGKRGGGTRGKCPSNVARGGNAPNAHQILFNFFVMSFGLKCSHWLNLFMTNAIVMPVMYCIVKRR